MAGDWWSDNSIETVPSGETPNTSSPYPVQVAGSTSPAPTGDPRSVIMPILRRYPATPEGLQQAWPEIQRLFPGAVLEDSDEFVLPGYGRVDVGRAFEGGDPSRMAWVWQRGQPGTGTSGGAGTVPTLPPGYSTGTFTGGGRYPLASVMGPGLMQPWTTPFEPPDPQKIASNPAYQFRLAEGNQALQRAAASRGTLLTGGTLKDMNTWSQGLASQEYDNAYNRALGEYQQAYGIYGNNQANQYNRLTGVADRGAQAAASGAGVGSSFSNQMSNSLYGIGNAQAGGIAGSGAAWGNAVGGIGNSVMDYYLLSQILRG